MIPESINLLQTELGEVTAENSLPELNNPQKEQSDSVKREFKTSIRGNWTIEEDELLREAVKKYGGRNWKKISDLIKDRTDVQCLHRWQKVLRPGLVKGPWTSEEDDKVLELVKKWGVKSW